MIFYHPCILERLKMEIGEDWPNNLKSYILIFGEDWTNIELVQV